MKRVITIIVDDNDTNVYPDASAIVEGILIELEQSFLVEFPFDVYVSTPTKVEIDRG